MCKLPMISPFWGESHTTVFPAAKCSHTCLLFLPREAHQRRNAQLYTGSGSHRHPVPGSCQIPQSQLTGKQMFNINHIVNLRTAKHLCQYTELIRSLIPKYRPRVNLRSSSFLFYFIFINRDRVLLYYPGQSRTPGLKESCLGLTEVLGFQA